MKNLTITTLGFEVTRKCNLKCKHCLRGEAENIDMTKEIVDALFNSTNYKIKEIKYLSFTGGEPTLNPDIIVYIIEKIIQNNVDIINYVNFLTNGLIYDEKIIYSLLKLKKYLSNKEKSVNCIINYELSNDQYHKKIPKKMLDKYETLEIINKSSLLLRARTVDSNVNEGRAKENNIGGSKIPTSDNFKPDIKISRIGSKIDFNNLIYLAANGNIYVECTFSYKNFDKLSLGNIKENNLLEIITKNLILTDECI